MSSIEHTDHLFFAQTGLDRARVESLVSNSLYGCDDGELFLEYRQSESFSWDDGRLKSASFDTAQGFGLRAVCGEAVGYAHAASFDEPALQRAAEAAQAIKAGYAGSLQAGPAKTNRLLYDDLNPLQLKGFAEKVALLSEVDRFARALDNRVHQVSVSLIGSWQAIQIIRAGGWRVADIRPLVRLNVTIYTKVGDRIEIGSDGAGARVAYDAYFQPHQWQKQVREALRQSLVNQEAVASKAGETTVVLGSGWTGVLLHEAIGHGLEGDFNRKKSSAFSELIGQTVAAAGVTVVDDGTLDKKRGSLTIDDEGTPTQCTTLIENGTLVGYMQDRQNARLMGVAPTGNGRRESYAHKPMPRMTNTIMRGGALPPEEILASVKQGIYAPHFGGGSVDITSGKFVFNASEAYEVVNGKLGRPIKGCSLIGTGFEALKRISMVGNDSAMDAGVGTCGKAGQWVPVGVGQPSIRIDTMTVGGTAV